MAALPVVVPPSDLHSRIRAELEREPHVRAFTEKQHGNGHAYDNKNGDNKSEDNKITVIPAGSPLITASAKTTSPTPIARKAAPAPSRSTLRKAPTVRAMAHRANPRDVRDVWDGFAAFFNRPTNVAWASSFALAAFCLVLLARPDRRAVVIQRSPSSLPSAASVRENVSSKSNIRTDKIEAKADVAKSTAAQTKTSDAKDKALDAPQPLATALPPLNGEHPNFTLPENGYSAPLPVEAAQEDEQLPQVPPARPQVAASAVRKPPPAVAQSTPAATLAPYHSAPSTTIAAATIARQPQKTLAGSTFIARAPEADADARRPAGFAASNGAAGLQGPAGAAGFSAPSPAVMAAQPAASGMAMQKSAARSSVARSEATTVWADAASVRDSAVRNAPVREASPVFTAPPATYRIPRVQPAPPKPQSAPRVVRRARVSTPPNLSRTSTRFVTAHIRAPRTVGWGQVSVVLTGGARFSDGGHSRVIWRGSAGAGEPIEVSFSVTAPRGDYSAQLSLQQIKSGDAQTLASDSVSINLR
jgi:hypothetical protein